MIDKEKNKLLYDINKELENNPKDFLVMHPTLVDNYND